MDPKQPLAEEGNDSMGKILLKISALGVVCIGAAWGILKLLEQF